MAILLLSFYSFFFLSIYLSIYLSIVALFISCVIFVPFLLKVLSLRYLISFINLSCFSRNKTNDISPCDHYFTAIKNHINWIGVFSVGTYIRPFIHFVARFICGLHLSRVMRKPTICICENKDAYREADQRLCFRYLDSTISLLPKYKISSL